jgi:hypothetical protein
MSKLNAAKLLCIALLVILVGSTILSILFSDQIVSKQKPSNFYFGVSYGEPSADAAKPLIDKVKDYTNVFIIDSWDITTNETALNEVCNFCVQANLKFIVYFAFISRIIYPWHQTWLDTAKQQWGDNFLGVYLQDELGGRQLDGNFAGEPMGDLIIKTVPNATNYADAANKFVNTIASMNSTIDAKKRDIPLFIGDYALHWFDYKAGYDTVLAELAWNYSTPQQIALVRGAADVQGKDWGTIVTWKYRQAPYMPNASELYNDMVASYIADAKYVFVFNYPTYPDNNPYGVLSEEHFAAMKQFWYYVNTYPRETFGVQKALAALVLPADYGWAMRRTPYFAQDTIWGLWPEDDKAPLILNNTNTLVNRYGLRLDIVYDDANYNLTDKYQSLYYWNSTLI